MTNVPYTTVCTVLRKFVASGKRIDLIAKERQRHFNCIPDRIKRFLLMRETLQRWIPYSINERV